MNLTFFFHARISGGKNVDSGVSIDPASGRNLFRQQMAAFDASGLRENCSRFVIGLNGSVDDADFARRFIKGNVELVWHGPDEESLLPTVALMQRELRQGSKGLIGFGHTKGVTQPDNALYTRWRECMMQNVVTRWRRCVTDLGGGNYDAAGCHWTHNSPNDQNAHDWGANSYFAGCFWWATEAYLLTLPKVPQRPKTRHDWFKVELLLGNGNPRIRDYHPGSVMQHA